MTVIHAYVETADGFKWIQVDAPNLTAAMLRAQEIPEVIRVLEVSWIPGGVET